MAPQHFGTREDKLNFQMTTNSSVWNGQMCLLFSGGGGWGMGFSVGASKGK